MSSLGVNRTSKENTEPVSTRVRANGEGIIRLANPITLVHDPRVIVVDALYLTH